MTHLSPLICQVAIPAADAIPHSWLASQTEALDRVWALEAMGNEDFFEPIGRTIVGYRDQTDSFRVAIAAVDGVDVASLPVGSEGLPLLSWDAREAGPEGRLLGTGSVDGSLNENLEAADLNCFVAPEHRRRGIGTAISRALEDLARAHGRSLLTVWTDHRAPVGDEPTLAPPSGAGEVPVDDKAAAFLRAHGYALGQCEVHSVWQLADATPTLDRLWDEAIPHADGYRIVAFDGRVPDEYAESLVALFSHFTEEVPTGDLEVEPEVWDVERLRRGEARRAARGDMTFTALAIHEATGAVVAETDVTAPKDRPVAAYQNVTVVDARHRGHRLGMLVKVANTRQILASEYDVARIHTWNADENEHMLSINRALGFEPRLTEGAWQKKI